MRVNDLIEVTPEMIRAGAAEISSRWLDFVAESSLSNLWAETLGAVYLAMFEESRKSSLTKANDEPPKRISR